MGQEEKNSLIVFAVLGLLFVSIYVFSAPSPDRITPEFDGTFQAGTSEEMLFFSVEPGENLFQFANHDEFLYVNGSVKDLKDGTFLLKPHEEYAKIMPEQMVTFDGESIELTADGTVYDFTKTDNFTLRFNADLAQG